MKYKDDPKKCVEMAKDVLQEELKLDEMLIGEWLDRLNLAKYCS